MESESCNPPSFVEKVEEEEEDDEDDESSEGNGNKKRGGQGRLSRKKKATSRKLWQMSVSSQFRRIRNIIGPNS